MNIQQVSPEQYSRIFPTPSHIYNSVAFNELNLHKCDEMVCLTVSDERGLVRFGLIAGMRDGILRSPFSAPYGGMESACRQRATAWAEAAAALKNYLGDNRLKTTLPPLAYDTDGIITRQAQALMSAGATVLWSDYNYHLPLVRFRKDYLKSLDCKVRNTYKTSLNRGFEFVARPLADAPTLATAREIVFSNHSALGYPVHLSAADLADTARVIPIDVFFVTLSGSVIASAIVYHNTPDTLQLIYWGDLLDYRDLHPMNFLAYKLFEYYAAIPEMRLFDMGPSSSEGIPAGGLCNFKEGLGCDLSLKLTLQL